METSANLQLGQGPQLWSGNDDANLKVEMSPM